ncbi:MAG: hypothetical protein IPI78_18115 [Chitinophagaceae bacterium]|nr:hypothetical protein [Chitinophagaceae bacterium]
MVQNREYFSGIHLNSNHFHGNKSLLEEVKTFPSYPSASGIEKLNNKFYSIGDDAKFIDS